MLSEASAGVVSLELREGVREGLAYVIGIIVQGLTYQQILNIDHSILLNLLNDCYFILSFSPISSNNRSLLYLV